MNIADYLKIVSEIELNVIVGSILGDGSLALYGISKNAYYREHGCNKQIPYRQWKANKLERLGFKLKTSCKFAKLSSPSNPLFTELYRDFYINRVKTITENNIKLLSHPIGLACFYMDDGTLVMDFCKRKINSIFIFPRISLYTLCFSEEENIIIKDYLKRKFVLNLKLKYRKDGKKTILEVNKREDIVYFIDLVYPYVNEVLCMKYKIQLEERFQNKKTELENKGYFYINSWDRKIISKPYSLDEEKIILTSLNQGLTYSEIAELLNRPYWGVVDKIRRMKKKPE